MQAIVRAWLPAVAVLILGWLCATLSEPHHALPVDAPAQDFSAARAERVLAILLADGRPHSVGSAAEAEMQRRIVAEFRALGIPVQSYRAFVCNTWRGFDFIPCGTVEDIVAEVLPGTGPAVLMMAHADSVTAGPGAADDGAGVACVLEAARALRASAAQASAPRAGGAAHPVLALISDGEEAGLLGAAAFLQNPTLARRVGAAVNVEARGTRGASLLFQTSPGNARLLQLYAKQVRYSAASSLFADIYRHLPNDTDLTLFIRAGTPAVNFAIAENVAAYHTPLDRLSALSLASAQMQGDNLLGMTRALQRADFWRSGTGDAVYLTTLGYFLPRMPARAALPVALLVLLPLLWAARRITRATAAADHASGPALRAAVAPLVVIVGSLLLGAILSWLAQWISGADDPSYAHPLAMRAALDAALWLMLLLASGLGTPRQLMLAVWLWIGVMGLLAAWLLPAVTPYLLWPALVATALLCWNALPARDGRERGRHATRANPAIGAIATVAAFAMLVLWLPLATGSTALLGLRSSVPFMLAASLGIMTLLPLLASWVTAPVRRVSATVCAAALLGLGIVAGLQPPYSAAAPERLNLIYFENARGAHWIADTAWNGQYASRLPPALRQAGGFEQQALALPGLLPGAAFVASAGAPRLPLPRAQMTLTPQKGGVQEALIHLAGSPATDEMELFIPPQAALRAIDIGDQHLLAPAGWSGSTQLLCVSRDCRDETVRLQLASTAGEQLSLPFVEYDHGLPAFGNGLLHARGPWAVPSQDGDEVMLAGQLEPDVPPAGPAP